MILGPGASLLGMDAKDDKILGLLRANARSSFSELGRRVQLSTNAVAARVRRMEQEGTIVGYTVQTGGDVPAARGGLEVFIDVLLGPGTDYDSFVDSLRPLDQVVEAIHMTGGFDYLLRAHVADTGALDMLLRRLKKDCGAAQTQTRVALRQPTARRR